MTRLPRLFYCAILGLLLAGSAMANSLTVGATAPDFKAPATGGRPLSISDFKGRWVVLYFFPKAFTPGCTAESCALRDGYREIQKTGAVILGASLDTLATQEKFKEKYNLPFELLADDQKHIARAYGVMGLFGLYAQRKTFIIDPSGKIAHVFDTVHAAHHDDDVLQILKKLTKEGSGS